MSEDQHKTMGFDPGSFQWKIAVIDDGGTIAMERLDTGRVSEHPGLLRDIIHRHLDGLRALAAPSGFGLPLTTIESVGERELRLMTLKRNGKTIVGLSKTVDIFREIQEETGIKCFILPSVKHLPTVPRWRKISRIDMGTSDKVCSVAWALQRIHEKLSRPYEEVSFVLAEVGHSFVSMVCVKGGEIVDGIGGTNVSFGTKASGALDAELAHIWSFPEKAGLYSGGLTDAAGMGLEEIEGSLSGGLSGRAGDALKRLGESFASDALAISSRNGIRHFVLSSSVGPQLTAFMERALRDVGLRPVTDLAVEESAALGAAYIANGIIGGRYQPLAQILAIASSTGSVLDDIFFSGEPLLW